MSDVQTLDDLVFIHMRTGDQEPTEFGWFLLRKMAEREPQISQEELALRTGVSQSTISRWIKKPGLPDSRKLKQLAEVLGVSHGELLHLAGHGQPSEDVSEAIRATAIDPLAVQVDRLIGDRSPLSDEDQRYIRDMLERLIAPYRRHLRGKRSA